MKHTTHNTQHIILNLFLSLFFFLNSCNKDKISSVKDESIYYFNSISSTLPPCIFESQKQLTWIAKALPTILNANLKNDIEIEMQNDSFFVATNTEIQNKYLTSSSQNYNFLIQQSLTTNFPGNDYNNSYFYDFICDNCKYTTFITSPNFDYVDRGTTIYVVPACEDFESDSAMGYYLNANDNLDSVMVNEEFLEDHYVWILSTESDCSNGYVYGPGGSDNKMNKRGPCNFKDGCEPALGENALNCSDCTTEPNTTNYTLFLLEYETLRDNKGGNSNPTDCYQESWLKGKYSMSMQFMNLRNLSASSTPDFKMFGSYFAHSTDDNSGIKHGGIEEMFILNEIKAHGKRSKVARCKIKNNGSTCCNKGTNTTFNQSILLTSNYMPYDLIYFIMYEMDNGKTQGFTTPESAKSFKDNDNRARSMFFNSREKPYTFNSTGNAWKITGDSNWVTEVINNETFKVFETTLDGELRVKFGYKPNF